LKERKEELRKLEGSKARELERPRSHHRSREGSM